MPVPTGICLKGPENVVSGEARRFENLRVKSAELPVYSPRKGWRENIEVSGFRGLDK